MWNTTKRPCLCNYFSRDPQQLLREIEACYTHPQHGVHPQNQQQHHHREETTTTTPSIPSPFFPILVPHGAYQDGGIVAAHAYAKFAEHYNSSQTNTFLPSTLILVGNSHSPLQPNPVVLSSETYQTPFGNIPVNAEICNALISSSNNNNNKFLGVNNFGHRQEHSIENQIPFLQHIYANSNKKQQQQKQFTIVPILVANTFSSISEIEPISDHIVNTIKEITTSSSSSSSSSSSTSCPSIGLVSTTDFSHVGKFYGELPPRGMSIIDYTRKQDKRVIDELLKLNNHMDDDEQVRKQLQSFVTVGSQQSSACGIWSTALSVLLARKFREKIFSKSNSHTSNEIRLLKYAVASEIFYSEEVTGFGAFTL